MRRKSWLAFILVGAILCGGAALAADAGSAGDPLISLSWLKNTFIPETNAKAETRMEEQMDQISQEIASAAATGTELLVKRGDVLRLGSGSSLIPLSGGLTVYVSGRVVDVTDGTERSAGFSVTADHRYLTAENSTAAYTVSTDTATVQLTGPYQLSSGSQAGPRFTDVPENAYYAAAVDWAVESRITNGTSATTFSPDKGCTRAEVVTFLWRAAGSPAVTCDVPFTDVADGAYYTTAVLWAVENQITNGTSATTFSPTATCTRGQIVTFLYRAAGQPAAETHIPFTDVAGSAYYAPAVAWAVAHGITNGTSGATFSPDDTCTRAQVVTFLWRTPSLVP